MLRAAGAAAAGAAAAAAGRAASAATPDAGPAPGPGTRSLWQHELANSVGWRSTVRSCVRPAAYGLPAEMEEDGWLRTSETLPERVDVVVVGAGLSGASCARELAGRGVRTLLVDARGIGGGASGRNGGLCQRMSLRELPVLVREGGLWHAVQTMRMKGATAAMYRELAARHDIGLDEAIDGIAMFQSEEGIRAKVGYWWYVRWLLWPFGVDVVTGAALREHLRLQPDAPDLCFGMIRLRKGFDSISPAKTVAALTTDAVRRGAQVHTHTRVLSVKRGSPHVVRTDRGVVAADKIVYATNAWTERVVPEMKGKITPVRNHVCSLAPARPLLLDARRAGFGHNDGFDYWLQRRDRRVVVGGFRYLEDGKGVNTYRDDEMSPAAAEACSTYLQKHFELQADVEHRWTGVMGWSCDDNPWVGALPEPCSNEWICAGFCGSGLWRAATCGAAVADMVATGAPARPYVDAYAPSWDRGTSADLYAGHSASDQRWVD